jgi:hypothetical protein
MQMAPNLGKPQGDGWIGNVADACAVPADPQDAIPEDLKGFYKIAQRHEHPYGGEIRRFIERIARLEQTVARLGTEVSDEEWERLHPSEVDDGVFVLQRWEVNALIRARAEGAKHE